MDFLALIGVAFGLWLLLGSAMAFAWWIEQRSGNSGWVDVVWTCAMGVTSIIGATALFAGETLSNRQMLISVLVLLWSLRLAGYIGLRTSQISDDPRYMKLRDQWGIDARRNMFWLLQAQAALSVPMVLSVVLGAWNPSPLFSALDWIALIVFGVALLGSAVADLQLSQFKKRSDSSGRVCDTGLWSWSRHPNYFFEWLIWVSFALLAFNLSGAWSLGYVALIGPACMYWLLRYVSGVPPLEEHMSAKYGDAYATYQRTTSVFFPRPPSTVSH